MFLTPVVAVAFWGCGGDNERSPGADTAPRPRAVNEATGSVRAEQPPPIARDSSRQGKRATTDQDGRPAGRLPEEALASIDTAKADLELADIRPYRKLLDYFDLTCPETRVGIADLAVRATELLADDGIEMSTLQVLRGVRALFAGGRDDPDARACAEIFAQYVTDQKAEF